MGIRYRIKFSKRNQMKFIGHLDMLRLFQRAVNRAGLPVAYSTGFNPHQLVSFALPLPIGMEGLGEYVDLETECPVTEEALVTGLNGQMPSGLEIIMVKKLIPGERNGAALVLAADYEMQTVKPIGPEVVERLLAQKEIIVRKKTKSGIKAADIRPDILSVVWKDGMLAARLSAGGVNFLKPQLLMECLYEGEAFDPFTVSYVRKALLMKTDHGLKGLLLEA